MQLPSRTGIGSLTSFGRGITRLLTSRSEQPVALGAIRGPMSYFQSIMSNCCSVHSPQIVIISDTVGMDAKWRKRTR